MPLSKNDIKFLKSLQQKKFRDLEQLFVVEGVKLANEILASSWTVKSVYHTAGYSIDFQGKFETIEISEKDLERISGLKTPNKVLVVAMMPEAAAINFDENNLVLLLDDIKDPGNFGTIIRTADWFGIKQIICSPESVDHFNPKVVQASMGSLFNMNVVYADLIESLKMLRENGFKSYGADMNGTNAFVSDFPSKTALVMGSESHGLSDILKSELELITIPKFGKSESLNVAMATGILLAKYRQ